MIGNFYTCESLGLPDLNDERVTALGEMLHAAKVDGRFFLGAYDERTDGEFHEVSETVYNAVVDEICGEATTVSGLDVPEGVTNFSITHGHDSLSYYVRKEGVITEVASSEYWDFLQKEREATKEKQLALKLKGLPSYMDDDENYWVMRKGEDYHTQVTKQAYDAYNHALIIQPLREGRKDA
jgi:hypothetical protein